MWVTSALFCPWENKLSPLDQAIAKTAKCMDAQHQRLIFFNFRKMSNLFQALRDGILV